MIEAGPREVVPWGNHAVLVFPEVCPGSVERFMKKCSVVKKVWEMLRFAKSDRFLH